MKINIVLLLAILTFVSCSKTELNISESDLLGEHWSENSFINGQPASDFLDNADLYPTILGLREENFYFLDYSSGEWSLEDDNLILSNRGNFKIITYTDSLFTMEGQITANQLYRNLNGIDDEELITLRQDYRRK